MDMDNTTTTTGTEIASRTYYAKQSPRGFGNETHVHAFASKAGRDAWVSEHANDGDVNAAVCGAKACTAREARSIIGYTGDAATRSYNGFRDHR